MVEVALHPDDSEGEGNKAHCPVANSSSLHDLQDTRGIDCRSHLDPDLINNCGCQGVVYIMGVHDSGFAISG